VCINYGRTLEGMTTSCRESASVGVTEAATVYRLGER
jgi:hypothetical protein